MKASTANQNLISTSPLFSVDDEESPTLASNPANLPSLKKNSESPDLMGSDDHEPAPGTMSADSRKDTVTPTSLPESNEATQEEDNFPTPYEVKHIVVGELEPDDDVWNKQKQRTDAFLKGVSSAKKWAPVLAGDTQQLPDAIRTKLYDPDVPSEIQDEDVKSDIMKEWYAEHFPESHTTPEEMEKMWPDIRESLAESLNTPPDDHSLYQTVSQKNKDYNATLKELEKQFQRIEKQAHQTFSSSEKEENFLIPEDWLTNVPDEIRPQVKQSLAEHHQEEMQRVKRLKPLYNEMRKAIKSMASFEEVKTVTLPMGNKAGGYEEIKFPLMLNIPELIKEYPALPVTGVKLRQLSPEDRLLLFSQVDQDIMAERKQNPPPEKGLLSEWGHAVSRSHMKGVYGITNLSTAFDAFSKDLAAQILDMLPDSTFNDYFSAELKDLAKKDRDTMANIQKMRDLAENKENPLYPQSDERGNMPKQHWLKQCLLGFAEESVPIALAVGYKPALLGWGGATVGNKYARYEAEDSEKRDYEAVQSGTSKESSSLAHTNRLLSAIAMGGLQTLLEAGAYGKAFSPIIKSLPKTSAAVGIGVRPYLEQKAIALTEPLGATSAEYVTRGWEEGKWDTFDSDRMVDALGTTEDNTREYLMNLPFILLATGKIALHHFKSRKTILNDPTLSSRYKIPQKMINRIKNEKDTQAQSLLLQKALRESPIWENPHILYTTNDFLNKIELSPYSGNTMGRYTPGSLAQLLELPPDKVKYYLGTSLPEQKLVEKQNPSFFTEKSTPLEKKQMYWHARSGLPSLSPVIKNNQVFWNLKYPEKTKYYGAGLYESPEKALVEWQINNKANQFQNKEQAFSKAPLVTDPAILKVNKEGNKLESKIQKQISTLEDLSSEWLLYRHNSNHIRQQKKRALNSLEKKEHERTKSHIIEDTMQYAMDIPSEQIVSNRLARMWSEELKNKRISTKEATEWIDHWESIFQKKLIPISIEGFSSKHPYSSLSQKLTRLSMQDEILTNQNILPPAFTEPMRLTFKQLANSNELAKVLPETLFYSSARRSGATKEDAFYKTLKNYIPQHEKITRKNTTYFKKSDSATPSLKNKPSVLDDEFKQDLLWMEEQGISPLLSLSNKKTGKTQWLTIYPDGRFSRPHATPQEALLEWKEYGLNTSRLKLDELGEKATDSLIDFYYGKNKEKRPDIKLTTNKKIKKTDTEWDNERDKIYKLQNPHVAISENFKENIEGGNWTSISDLGNIQNNINLHTKSDPLAIIEEHAEISWKDFIRNNFISIKEALSILKKVSKETKNTYIPHDIEQKKPHLQYYNIIEGLSQFSREYMMTQYTNKTLPLSLREWISHMYSSPSKEFHAIPLLRRSTALNNALKEERIPQDTLSMLKESVGLNERLNNERKLPNSDKRNSLLPLLYSPRKLFYSLPEQARLTVSEKLFSSQEKSTLTPSLLYKKTNRKLSQLENDINRYPELLEWDYDENKQTYMSLDNTETKSSTPPKIRDMQEAQLEKNIKTISLLRRSMDEMPYSDTNGIRLKNKVFSEKSEDRPKGMNHKWTVRLDSDSEGLVYTNSDLPGHVVRLSPGFIMDQHIQSKRPYIRHIVKGNYLDTHGNIKSPYSPATFIPLEKFSYVPPHSFHNSSQYYDTDILDTLSDKKRLKGLLYTPNVAEMSTPTEFVFQLGQLEQKISFDKKAMELFIPLYQSVNSLKRYPTTKQTDLDALSLQAKKLKNLLLDKQKGNNSQEKQR